MPWEVRLIEHTHTQTVGAHVVTLSHSHTHTLTHTHTYFVQRKPLKHKAFGGKTVSHILSQHTLAHSHILLDGERERCTLWRSRRRRTLTRTRTHSHTHARTFRENQSSLEPRSKLICGHKRGFDFCSCFVWKSDRKVFLMVFAFLFGFFLLAMFITSWPFKEKKTPFYLFYWRILIATECLKSFYS